MRRVGSGEGGRVPGTAGGGKVPALHHHLGAQPPAVPARDEHCCPASPPSPGAVPRSHSGGRARHPDRAIMSTSLRAVLGRGGLREAQITTIGRHVALALNYMHQITPDPILHRDVSSANVLLNPAAPEGAWVAKLSDYGSANFTRLVSTAGPGNPSQRPPTQPSRDHDHRPSRGTGSQLHAPDHSRPHPAPRREQCQRSPQPSSPRGSLGGQALRLRLSQLHSTGVHCRAWQPVLRSTRGLQPSPAEPQDGRVQFWSVAAGDGHWTVPQSRQPRSSDERDHSAETPAVCSTLHQRQPNKTTNYRCSSRTTLILVLHAFCCATI